jgi:hypothetical protein
MSSVSAGVSQSYVRFAGCCYLVNSLALLLAPGIAALLFPAIMLPVLIAELSLSLWMIVKGANMEQGRK